MSIQIKYSNQQNDSIQVKAQYNQLTDLINSLKSVEQEINDKLSILLVEKGQLQPKPQKKIKINEKNQPEKQQNS